MAFVANLIMLTFNVGVIAHDRPTGFRVCGAVISAIGVRLMWPVVVARLQGKE